jgi:putative membrane-bound dehydrogenase-like protein
MFRLSLVFAVAFAPSVAPAAEPPTHQVKLNGHTFTLPVGFTVELAAGADLVPRPIACDFDEKGRLYVTDSSGSNENVKLQLEKKPHRILRLEDTNGDGTFDRATVFVKNVMFPEGCMWLDGSLYVAAPPHILKFTDTNDDGVADREEVWFDGKTLTGCANDLHGPYRGPDGRIYWTKGAFAKQEYTVDGKPFATRAAHIFRAKPDGTGLEPVMTGGMDNPVDVVFTPSGDLIFSTTFFQHPAGGKRDGLVHATYGAVYGKDHDPVYEHPWTHPTLTPPMTHLGPAAPCGLHRLERDQFGPEYTNNLFCCQFNLRKVSRHVLVPKGSTYETKDSDFLVSDNLDFHPTDVIEDADGSLLVVDTGGWYKLCCPTSQLVKPDVTGAIYRVKKIGSHREKVQPKPQPLPRLVTIARDRDASGLDEAVKALTDPDPHTRRRAAEALGRIGQPRAVPAILAALADDTNDRPLDTALTAALIAIGDGQQTRAGLKDRSPRVRRACLAALSNIPKSGLVPSDVLAELDAADAALRETAWWVAGRNPQWGDRLAGYFAERLKVADRSKPDEQAELVDRLVKFATNTAVRDVLTATIRTGSRAGKLVAVRTLARAGLKTPSPEWGQALSVLPLTDAELLREYLLALRSHPPTADDYNRMQVAVARHEAESGRLPDEVRLAVLAVAPPKLAIADADFRPALGKLDREQPPAVRAAAAEVMLRRPLTDGQLVALAAALKTANPLDLPKLLTPFEKSRDETVGRALVKALREPVVRRAVREELVKPILDKYPAAVKAEAETLYAELAEARKGEREKLDALLANLKPGDVRRGQLVFNSTKTQCIACHKMGYVGGTVGPDLTRIGGIRSERDLLEAIVFPSASFVRSYEPVRVVTTDDRIFNGILKKDAPDGVIVVVAADREERIPRAEVAEIGPGSVSLMPSGLDQQLTPQELADLVAFLKASK